MLTTYHSNRLENLADQLAAVIGKPLRSPLTGEIIVVQSNGVGRWLSMRLAQRLGVFANVRFPFPATFLWEMLRAVLKDVPETSLFDSSVLTWRLMALLRNLEGAPRFEPLRAYLQDGDDFKYYDLAYRIADSFDQYLIYRPDWITRWEVGEGADHWQAALWRRLASEGGEHRVRLQQRFLKALDAASAELPERVSIIGISAMPPMYLELFSRLAQYMDVHLFLLNPCQEYWGDIVAERDIARRGTDVDAAAMYLTVGNNLLASLGKQGRDFIDLLQAYPCEVIEDFAEPDGDSLLCCLQRDILNLVDRGGEDFPPFLVNPTDRSLRTHACHSPMREVEVLYDQLLALFHANPDLRPADVVVMTPDIDAYGPAIEAVFATATGDRRIPFSIADRNSRTENPLVDAFFNLLDLPGSRFDANRLLALLETEAVRRRFGISEAELTLVQHWVRETGIRWGIDPDGRAALDLPATREHTWRAGLDRLLLGYALPGGNRMWDEILPYDDVEGSEAQLMGRLQGFAEAIFCLNAEFGEQRPLNAWAIALHGALAQFFAPLDAEQDQAQLIRDTLESLAKSGERAGFEEPASLEVVKAALRCGVDTARSVGRFFSGGVTFCTMLPMRSIPFEVVCLIGMNSDSYPRSHRPLGFDLMAEDFRRGDRSRRNDDRYLFLEALLSARRCLYLSYVGNDIRDNTVIPPSVLVSELLDNVVQDFYMENSDILEHVLIRHPLQPFSRRYFSGDDRLFSYSEALADASRGAGRGEAEPLPFITTGLPAPDEGWRQVGLESFIRFFANPTRYLLRQRLGIQLEERAGLLDTREPFVLDNLAGYGLRQELLEMRLSDLELARALPLARAGGVLPHGQVGECEFHRQRETVERFAGRVVRVLPKETLEPLEVDLTLGAVRLSGWLKGVSPQGIVGYRLARVRPLDYLALWIHHLLLNILAPEQVTLLSHWLGQDRDVVLNPVADPESHLRALLDCYWQGLQWPLRLFPRSALAYVETALNKKTKTLPQVVAQRIWEGNDHVPGEGEDPYYRLAFRGVNPLDEEFRRLAVAVFQPLLRHVEGEG